MVENPELDSEHRRSLMQTVALAGGGVSLSGLVSGGGVDSEAANLGTKEDKIIDLGQFENGRDGWKTDGGNSLETVSKDDFPAAVANGDSALRVDIGGDLYPAIRKNLQKSKVDLSDYHRLRTHVVGFAENSDSNLLVQFRLHHKPTKGKKSSKGKGSSSDGTKKVVTSDMMEVPQVTTEELEWDFSEVADEKVESARRLEIAWYLKDHPPSGGPRGRSKGDHEYRGLTFFDDIRALKGALRTDVRGLRGKKRRLHREHGMIVRREFDRREREFESGELVFSDSTSVGDSFEVVGEDRFRYTLDGEAFEIGGGWQ